MNVLKQVCLITTNAIILLILILTCYIQERDTPLLFASRNGLSDVAQLLISKGASMDVTDKVSYMYLCLNNILVM